MTTVIIWTTIVDEKNYPYSHADLCLLISFAVLIVASNWRDAFLVIRESCCNITGTT